MEERDRSDYTNRLTDQRNRKTYQIIHTDRQTRGTERQIRVIQRDRQTSGREVKYVHIGAIQIDIPVEVSDISELHI